MQTTEYELRDRIDQLANYHGEGTELITVAVPPDKSLHAVRERIDREYAQAANIKSDQTRTHVQDALGRIRRLLQIYEETPPNGLVIYAGVVDGELHDAVFDDLDVPVDVSLYRCAAEFETTPVEQVLIPSEVYGLVVLERGRAALGRLVGERIVSIRTFESQVMGNPARAVRVRSDLNVSATARNTNSSSRSPTLPNRHSSASPLSMASSSAARRSPSTSSSRVAISTTSCGIVY